MLAVDPSSVVLWASENRMNRADGVRSVLVKREVRREARANSK